MGIAQVLSPRAVDPGDTLNRGPLAHGLFSFSFLDEYA
jgi:hypothetical protein